MNFEKSHPPSWLEHSKVFETLYALSRLLFYNKSAKGSDTDNFLRRLVYHRLLPLNGFYVDVGCFHPKKGNNTYCLNKRFNYSGINIDMDAVPLILERDLYKFLIDKGYVLSNWIDLNLIFRDSKVMPEQQG